MKKTLTVLLILEFIIFSFHPSHAHDLLTWQKLSDKKLFDTADYYFSQNDMDTALICYSLLVKNLEKNDREQQLKAITALNRMGVIYMNMSDYRNAYKNLIDALLLCEKHQITSEQSKIYTNLGNIYYHFKKYDIAKLYYHKALFLNKDSLVMDGLYNNVGIAMFEIGEIDSAFYFLNKALNLCTKTMNDRSSAIFNSVASLYQKAEQYDSAYHYYNLSLKESRKYNQIKYEIQNLSDIGTLFFKINKTDSALFYIALADTLAERANALKVIAANYLIRANIEESKGNTKRALTYFKKYATLNDSVFNTSIFGDINQIQRLYEVSKTDKQIEELIIKQKIREYVIYAILCILILVSLGLLYIWSQKRNLNKAYNVLFEKNLEIIDLKEDLSTRPQSKNNDKKKDYVHGIQDELFEKISAAMENSALFCDPGFSIDKLTAIVQSNHTYVSQAITNVANKNFRSFLNGYRIREAQRIFAKPDASKYTIESVALKVGFKSRSAFYNAFKEITGVTPNFYLKSMQNQR